MYTQYVVNNLKIFELTDQNIVQKSFSEKQAEFGVFFSQNGIMSVFFSLTNQVNIIFLFLELSKIYILRQKIISTDIQYGVTCYKSLQVLPCLWWKGYYKIWLY